VRARYPRVPVIVVTGTGSEEVAVEAMKQGAADYVIKTPKHIRRLPHTIRAAIERRQAEEALRESEQRFRELTENIREVFWMTDPDKGQMLYVSPGYETIWGRTCESLYQSPLTWVDTIHPEDRDRVLAAALAKQALGEYDEEYRIVRPDGAMRWIRDRAFPVRDQTGEVHRIAGIAEDITERKRAEEAHRQSEERYRLLYEDNPSMYFTVDAEGAILSVNRFGAKQLGYTPEELLGHSVLKVVYEDDKQAALDMIRASFQNHAQPVQWEIRKVRKDGSNLWVRELARTVRDADGRLVGLIVCEDITERRRLEEQLRQAQKLESIGLLAGGVAHDFNNLLNGIIGFTELALREVAPDSKVHRYLSRVPQLGHQASELIAQLLAFARKAPMERKPLDLNLLLNETGKLLQRTIPESIAIELAPASQPVVVQADLAQVQQILLNLSTNARDAMPKGGRLSLRLVPVTISQEGLGGHPDRRQGQFVCLTVADTGTGIPAAIRDRIFEPFFTTKESGKGTGLGLASAHGIVHQHDGWIEVETAEGQGTAFHVFLPLLSIPAAVPQSVGEAIPRGVETVLLVEDNPMVRELGENILIQLGYTVFVAADGIEALEAFRAHPEIALAVTDAVMPRMGAVDLIPSLRALNPAIKVLVATGYAPEQIRTTLEHLQLSWHIQKPFRLAELAQAVRSALDQPVPPARGHQG
ncbi:MAG TPA: PAS domain S-box protein, partial [Candidatus Methylomirabilis sp.]|nr:PAS domain S-box protein [Candidatus Methylomirabilis sp.]